MDFREISAAMVAKATFWVVKGYIMGIGIAIALKCFGF